jgi:hypothetical protein
MYQERLKVVLGNNLFSIMKKLFILLLCLSLFLLNKECIAQGLIINDNTLPTEEPTRSTLPIRASLEKYCPSVINQSNTSMCVAFSLSTIRTIIYARNNNITDVNQIDKNRFSPTFLKFLVSEMMIREDLGLDNSEEEWTQELLENCLQKNKRN